MYDAATAHHKTDYLHHHSLLPKQVHRTILAILGSAPSARMS